MLSFQKYMQNARKMITTTDIRNRNFACGSLSMGEEESSPLAPPLIRGFWSFPSLSGILINPSLVLLSLHYIFVLMWWLVFVVFFREIDDPL